MFKRTKAACYVTNLCMSVVCNLSPLLFITFRELYDISYSLLGSLVLINFCTQLSVDLIFSFFSHRFNIKRTVRSIPIITFIGLVIFAMSPYIFGDAVFIGLVLGTLIFSAASGLMEVLASPVIAAIPSKNPERDMSMLHSTYAFGVVGVILFGTLFLHFFDGKYWPFLTLIFASLPIIGFILFVGAEIPNIKTPEKASGAVAFLKDKTLLICVFAIFLGGASECTMSQWSSGYIERALNIPKLVGDICGVAAFGLALGFGRWLYGKIGKNIEKVLLISSISATVCYLVTTFSPIPTIALIASALTGLATAMLWPGTLIVAAKKFPLGGVFIYALMAAGGDLGASVVPQLVGVVTDVISESELAISLSDKLSLTPEQIGMKGAMIAASIFPLIAILVYTYIYKTRNRKVTKK